MPAPFTYVYILESLSVPGHFYTGSTTDLINRLHEHNIGQVLHTAKFAPWSIKAAIFKPYPSFPQVSVQRHS